MEKENIEKIMEEYRSGLLKIEGKDKDNDIEINKMNLHIQRLRDEREEVKSEKALYEEYTKQIENAENELKNYKNKDTQTEINKINYRIRQIEEKKSELDIREYNRQMEEAKKELESLNKVETLEERKQKEIEKMNLKDVAIKNLTQANMNIDKAINEAELEHKIIMNKISNFELKYDENHIALNGNEQRELFDKSHKIIDRINDLKEAKTKCEEYLVELKQPSKEVETINSILNGTYDSKEESTKTEPAKVEPAKAEPEKTEPAKTEPTKVEPTKVEPAKTEPTKAEPAKTEPAKVESTKTEPTKVEQEKSDEEKVVIPKEVKTKEQQENKLKNVKTIHINGKESKIYVNKDEENPLKIYYGDDKDIIINEYIRNAFNEEIKDKETEQKKYAEFQYADPNIVAILKNNPEQLQEYADFLNGKKKIDKEQKMSFDIKYDIRGLSKSEMSDEEKQQIEDYAFIHRNIAKIKKTPFQAIKFAFKGLLEKFRKVKALPAGDLIKEDDYTMSDEGKKAYEKAYEKSRSVKESLNKVEKTEEQTNDNKENPEKKMNRYEEIAQKMNQDFLNQTASWRENIKVENKNNQIENNANNKSEEKAQENSLRKPTEKDLSE